MRSLTVVEGAALVCADFSVFVVVVSDGAVIGFGEGVAVDMDHLSSRLGILSGSFGAIAHCVASASGSFDADG